LKTSVLLQTALHQLLMMGRSKTELALSDSGSTVHFSYSGAVVFNSIGSVLHLLAKNVESSSNPETAHCSATQRLFVSDAYGFLTEAAKYLGFKTVSDLDEFGTQDQWEKMWEIAISNALLLEKEEGVSA